MFFDECCIVVTIFAGAAIDIEFVAGQPVMASVEPTPSDSFLATSEAVTIGDVSPQNV